MAKLLKTRGTKEEKFKAAHELWNQIKDKPEELAQYLKQEVKVQQNA